MNTPYIIAFDAGGTRLKTAVVDGEGQTVNTFHVCSHASAGADALLAAIISSAESIKSQMSGELAGIGLSLSGVVHPDKGVVYLPGKFKRLEGYPIVEKLKLRSVCPFLPTTTDAWPYMRRNIWDKQKMSNGPWDLLLAPALAPE